MKVLYAIQGTGNGHLTRALNLIPHFKRQVKVDLLVSGSQADIELPYPVKFRLNGLGYFFGKGGGINFWKTCNNASIFRFVNDVVSLPVRQYDLVINDFEPVSAWACRLKGVPAVGLSHQNAVLHESVPKPGKTDAVGSWILEHYAPCSTKFGFHFKAWGQNNFTPIICDEIRQAVVQDLGHITVYLPAFEDKRILKVLTKIKNVRWEVFSKHHRGTAYEKSNVSVSPISRERFKTSMINSHAVLCGAGFETPSEALYLGKKLLVIPMRGQFEQACNAAALHALGINVIPTLSLGHLPRINQWLTAKGAIRFNYPDQCSEIVQTVLKCVNRELLEERSVFGSHGIEPTDLMQT